MKRSVLVVAIAFVSASVLAGCLGGEADAGEAESVKKSAGAKSSTPPTDSAKPKTPDEVNETVGKRWHFHNYWGLEPNLTLFDAEVVLGATDPRVSAVPTRVTVGSATFGLAQGSIVPPETGTVTVTLHYNESPALGPVDVFYKPANSAEFIPAGRLDAPGAVTISVSTDMADVPHRGRSVWQFRLEAAPSEQGVGVANGTVHAVVVATIGRPIFIDKPHLDHWGGADTVPLVGAERQISALKPPAAGVPYVTVDPEDVGAQREALAEFPVVDGRVVPEGTKVVLARLTWSSAAPADLVLPALAYAEENMGSEEVVQPVSDKPGERIYRIVVLPRQTDSPYANQSTWKFRVILDGDGGAFAGSVRLDAWASRLPADSAPLPDGPAHAGTESVTASAISAPVAASPAQAAVQGRDVGRH